LPRRGGDFLTGSFIKSSLPEPLDHILLGLY
jgi:hypothetical protein